MIVNLRIDGGLLPAGIGGQITIDSGDLSSEAAAELDHLASRALAEKPSAGNPAARDASVYQLEVDTGNEKRSLIAVDGAIPRATGDLIQFVRRLAREKQAPS